MPKNPVYFEISSFFSFRRKYYLPFSAKPRFANDRRHIRRKTMLTSSSRKMTEPATQASFCPTTICDHIGTTLPTSSDHKMTEPATQASFCPTTIGDPNYCNDYANIIRSLANSLPLASSNLWRRSDTVSFFFSSPATS